MQPTKSPIRFILIVFLSALFGQILSAQQEAAVWHFGQQAGIDFSTGIAIVIDSSNMVAEAGCAAISDENGMLQFYTNGHMVWQRNNQVMPNGDGLSGSQILNQNSLIVPHPDSAFMYYVFTVNANFDSIGLNYSMVDMQRNNGLGEVTLKNQPLYKGLSEKLTGARHCNGEDIWVVSHDHADGYYSFLITKDSLTKTPVKSRTGNSIRADIGYLKMSPASNKIAFPLNNNGRLVELSRFHNRSGYIYDPLIIFARDSSVYAYGVEFSPDGDRLYIGTGGKQYKLWQYDLTFETESEINQSAELIATGNHFALQSGIDGKIYIAKENRNYLSIIQNPNAKGALCQYIEYGLDLENGMSLMGLPNYLPFYFYRPQIRVEDNCAGANTQLVFNQYQNSDSLIWDYGDGSPVMTTHSTKTTTHAYPYAADFDMQLFVHHCGIADTVKKSITIFHPPEVFLGNDTTICNSCTISLNGGEGMDYWLWQDGSSSQYFEVLEEGFYRVEVTKNGCTSSDSIYIYKSGVYVFMPNAFTPDGDGLNDVFKPVSSEPLQDFSLIILNRAGEVIFESTNSDIGWNGKYNSILLNNGVYVWKMVYTAYSHQKADKVEKMGTVTLLR